jgi:RNA polymerase sigma factor (TIGR02999 family)
MTEVTRILSAIEQGDPQAAEQLLPLVYDELRKLAAQKLAQEKPGQTLQATALVHEAYVRLVGSGDEAASEQPPWHNRRHFFAAAAEAMRRILIDNARRKQSRKHGGGRQRQDVDAEALVAPEPNLDLLALDAALARLAEHDPLKAKLVELRYFGGLTGDHRPGHVCQQCRSALGLYPGLAAPRTRLRRRVLTLFCATYQEILVLHAFFLA